MILRRQKYFHKLAINCVANKRTYFHNSIQGGQTFTRLGRDIAETLDQVGASSVLNNRPPIHAPMHFDTLKYFLFLSLSNTHSLSLSLSLSLSVTHTLSLYFGQKFHRILQNTQSISLTHPPTNTHIVFFMHSLAS